MKADRHSRERERLHALHDFNVLDTPAEQEFDDIVALTASICHAPISVVNLIDADRQWFKAEIGLGVRETPLSISICSHAILGNDFIEIEDTLLDARMIDNPLCQGEDGFRFYAGALLKTEEGLPIGTLCVLDRRPRRLDRLQKQALIVLAGQVMKQLELRRALKDAAVLRDEVDHRVKNSLQSVAALASLQARRSTDASVRLALEQVHRQILTVASLHELLYRVDADGHIDLRAYIYSVAAHLGRTGPRNVQVRAKCDPLSASSGQAAAIGTLLNEFASNSFKHAFPDRRQGKIDFDLKNIDGTCLLVCKDDGIGFDFSSITPEESLGFRVMSAAANQLGGHLEFSGVSTIRVAFEV